MLAENAYELLAPANDRETGIAAVNCGADAAYVGARRHFERHFRVAESHLWGVR